MPPKERRIVSYDANRMIHLYLGYDEGPEGKRSYVYGGQSINVYDRMTRHKKANSGCPLLCAETRRRHAERERAIQFMVVPGLEAGVPFRVKDLWEAWVIKHYGTLYDEDNNVSGLNQNNAPNLLAYKTLLAGRKRPTTVAAFAAMIADDPLYADAPAPVETPTMAQRLRGEHAVLETVALELHSVLTEPEKESYALCVKAADISATEAEAREEAAGLSLAGYAGKIKDKYAAMAGFEGVTATELVAVFTEIGSRLEEEDKVMIDLVRRMQLIAHPDKNEPVVNASFAKGLMIAIHERLLHLEEQKLDKTKPTIALFFEYRAIAVSLGGKQPVQNAKTRAKPGDDLATLEALEAEQSVASRMRNWKSRNGADEDAARLILRDFKWADTLLGSQTERSEKTEATLKTMLADGYGWHDDPFATKKFPKSGETLPTYSRLNNLVDGHGKEEDVDSILSDLPPDRRDWYKSRWAAKEAEFKEKTKAKTKARAEATKATNAALSEARSNAEGKKRARE